MSVIQAGTQTIDLDDVSVVEVDEEAHPSGCYVQVHGRRHYVSHEQATKAAEHVRQRNMTSSERIADALSRAEEMLQRVVAKPRTETPEIRGANAAEAELLDLLEQLEKRGSDKKFVSTVLTPLGLRHIPLSEFLRRPSHQPLPADAVAKAVAEVRGLLNGTVTESQVTPTMTTDDPFLLMMAELFAPTKGAIFTQFPYQAARASEPTKVPVKTEPTAAPVAEPETDHQKAERLLKAWGTDGRYDYSYTICEAPNGHQICLFADDYVVTISDVAPGESLSIAALHAITRAEKRGFR